MGKTILTPRQLDFLALAAKEPWLVKSFYLTGGTALAEFHLHHRLSEDLDFFTETAEVNPIVTESFLKKMSPHLGINQLKRAQFLGLVSFVLEYSDGDKLKVDFNYYPFPRINLGLKFRGLDIDSLEDIAVNKVHTLFMRPRFRDYIDLYCIMNHTHFDLQKLIINAKSKFDWHIDPVTLASQFARVKELKDFPKMLIPFDPKDMESFFLKLAKDLDKEIFK